MMRLLEASRDIYVAVGALFMAARALGEQLETRCAVGCKRSGESVR
jgi:hypothetical protein